VQVLAQVLVWALVLVVLLSPAQVELLPALLSLVW
jgi:hypothetical protein